MPSFVNVVDFAFDSEAELKVVGEASGRPSLAESRSIKDEINGLSTPERQTIRVYLEKGFSDNALYKDVLQRICQNNVFHYNLTSTSFAELLGQCQQSPNDQSVRWSSIKINMLYAHVNFMKGSEIAIKDVDTRFCYVIDAGNHAHLIVSFADISYGKLTSTSFQIRDYLERDVHSIGRSMVALQGMYRSIITAATTPQTLRQIALLCLLHAILRSHSRMLDSLHQYIERLSISLDEHSTQSINRFTQIATTCERVGSNSNRLTTTTESLLDIVLSSVEHSIHTAQLKAEVRALCTDAKSTMTSIGAHLDSHTKWQMNRRNAQEASKLHMISLLASVFLPLSLAASLLGMQTRFLELHWMLFDWVGIALLLGVFASCAFYVMKIWRLRVRMWMKARFPKRLVRAAYATLLGSLTLGFLLPIGFKEKGAMVAKIVVPSVVGFYICYVILTFMFMRGYRREKRLEAQIGFSVASRAKDLP